MGRISNCFVIGAIIYAFWVRLCTFLELTPKLLVEANWVARPGWQAKLSGFRIQRQKELNITINELNAIQNSRTSVEKKSIYLGIWPLYIGKSHTKECHISSG